MAKSRLYPLLLSACFLGGCGPVVGDPAPYRPCEAAGECDEGAACVIGTCRPSCATDGDCPFAEGGSAHCGIGGFAAGECVLIAADGCPDGMVKMAVAPEPTSPLVCGWDS